MIKEMIPRREGVWDSRVVAEAADRLLMEEQEDDGSDMMEQDLLEPVPMMGMADLRLRGNSFDEDAEELIDPRLRGQGGESRLDLMRRFMRP